MARTPTRQPHRGDRPSGDVADRAAPRPLSLSGKTMQFVGGDGNALRSPSHPRRCSMAFKGSVRAKNETGFVFGDKCWGQIREARSDFGRCQTKEQRPFAGLLRSPLTDSNRRPPLYEEGPWVKRLCIAWSWWLVWLLVLSSAHLSIASSAGEDQVGWEPRFRWRISRCLPSRCFVCW
jgi:hypothetical protein